MSSLSEITVRRSWVDAAYVDFLAHMPDSLVGRFKHPHGAAHVVTCGQVQVGKTTLVLSLLGARPESIPDLEAGLRGFRPAGRSATPGPMRYRWSDDESWTLDLPGGARRELLTSMEIAEAMRDMRAQLESGREDVPLVRVGLPRQHRDDAAGIETVVTDLPGVDAANPREMHAAQRMLERHASSADVIIAVLQADSLDKLMPPSTLGVLLAPFMLVPPRFRVVLTRAVQNLPDKIRVSEPSLATLLEFYTSEFFTHDYPPDGVLRACLESGLYLLDIGDSRDDQLFAAVHREADASLLNLRKSIHAAAIEQNRYLSATNSMHLVRRHYAASVDTIGSRIQRLDATLRTKRESLHSMDSSLLNLKADLADYTRAFHHLETLGHLRKLQLTPTRPATNTPDGYQVRSAKDETGKAFLKACKSLWAEWSAEVPPAVHAPRWGTLEGQVELIYTGAVNCCEKCTSKWYLRLLGDDKPDKCLKRTADGLSVALAQADRRLHVEAVKTLNPEFNKARTRKSQVGRRIVGISQLRDGEQRDIDRLFSEREGLASHLVAQQSEAAIAGQRAALLDKSLQDTVRAERQKHLCRLQESRDPFERLSLALTVLRDQRDLECLRDE